MRTIIIAVLLVVSTTLTGCIEIIEDLTLRSDNSGNYKLTINLSASKMKVKSLMAMDSLRGKKVPSELDIKKELQELVAFLNQQEGLSGAKSDINFDDLICKISVDFDALENLQKGLHSYAEEKSEHPIAPITIVERTDAYFKRSSLRSFIRDEWINQANKEDLEQLSESSLILITRFEEPLAGSNHTAVNISKNKLAGMYRANLLDLLQQKIRDDYLLYFATEEKVAE